MPAVELHTGRYAHTWRRSDAALDELRRAARHARDMGLFVHAGHGLTYLNVQPVAAIPEIEELNIGHSVVSRAVMIGHASGRAGDGALGEGRTGLIPYLRMTNPLATADFFALEAGECLDRLESARPPGRRPAGDDFLRASRVLRGSALMASQQPIARAAGGLESVARALREGRRAWDPGRAGAGGAGDRGVPPVWCAGCANGTTAIRARAGRLRSRLETLAGRPGAEPGEQRGEPGRDQRRACARSSPGRAR